MDDYAECEECGVELFDNEFELCEDCEEAGWQ